LSLENLQYVEGVLKILALGAGGAFFLWKLFTGWLIVNLDLSIITEREAKDESSDYLSVTLNLKKGATDSVWIKDISALVSPIVGAPKEIIHFSDELSRLQDDNGIINWQCRDEPGRKWTLSSGENLQLSCVVVVPVGIPVSVSAAVLGTRLFWPPGFQWRASVVSLPLKTTVSTPTPSAFTSL